MKFIFTLSALLTLTFAVSAQSVVTGRITASDGKGVAYATVSAQQGPSVIQAVASDADGNFSLKIVKEGKYSIEASSVGYTARTVEVEIAKDTNKNLGDIVLGEGVEVGAVSVTVQKPIITADAEKLAYSVEDDPEAKSSTLEDMIRKVPQLSIDAEGNVLMNGQSSFKILVNGHESKGMEVSFKDIIKSMPASSIQKIEVITNPSMKYDAEGTGGVLNIVMSKSKFEGYNGRLSSRIMNNFEKDLGTDNSASFTVQKNKFTLSGLVAYSYYNITNSDFSIVRSDTESFVPGSPFVHMITDAHNRFRFNELEANLRASYQIDSLNLVTAEFSVWDGKTTTPTQSTVSQTGTDVTLPFLQYLEKQSETRRWYGYDLTTSYEHSFRKEGHTLTVSDMLYLGPPINDITTSEIHRVFGPVIDYSTLDTSRNRFTTNIIQIDYANPLNGKHSIEAGAKHTWNYSRAALNKTVASASSNGLDELSQNTLGIYFGYTFKLPKFLFRCGSRLEGSWYSLENSTDGVDENYGRHLFNAIPYASLTYTIKPGRMLTASYTERLNRPGIRVMSPFVHEEATTRTYGNPDLKAGVSHTVNLQYLLMDNKWNLMVGYTGMFSSNQVARYMFMDAEGIRNTTFSNSEHVDSHTGTFSLTYRPSQRFSLTGSLNAGWHRFFLPEMGTKCDGWSMMQTAVATVGLWKGARLTASEYGMLMNPQLIQKVRSAVFYTHFQLSQKLCKDRLELAVQLSNPFSKYISLDIVSADPTSNTVATAKVTSRTILFSISYTFGKSGLSVKSTAKHEDSSSGTIGAGSEKGSAGGFGGM